MDSYLEMPIPSKKKHVCDNAARRRRAKRRRLKLIEADACLLELRSLKSFDDIADWLCQEENYLRLYQKQWLNGHLSPWTDENLKRRNPGKFKLTNVRFDHIYWLDKCSNSHSAPIGKKTNWCGQNRREPTGYPGYRGHISFDVIGANVGSNIFTATGLNTGTGNGGGLNCQFDITLFAQDWPMLVLNDNKYWGERSASCTRIMNAIIDRPHSLRFLGHV